MTEPTNPQRLAKAVESLAQASHEIEIFEGLFGIDDEPSVQVATARRQVDTVTKTMICAADEIFAMDWSKSDGKKLSRRVLLDLFELISAGIVLVAALERGFPDGRGIVASPALGSMQIVGRELTRLRKQVALIQGKQLQPSHGRRTARVTEARAALS